METQINIERIFFWIVSCILISSSLLPIQFSKLRFDDSQYFEEIARKKAQSKEKKKFGMTALNKELSIAVLTMGSLNIVILILNILDIRYVWLDYSSKTAAQLSQFVHAGTTNLIFAIILGIGVLLVFFRKNLNFHPMASLLRKLSYMWLIQNAFLALSTLIRNLHYVHSYGLTHKRLGVAVFTVIVGIGLFVVYQKIKYKQSLYHSFSKHSLATVFCLLIFGAINQEKLIILTSVYFQKENIDKRYLLSISDESDYLLYQYADQINAKINPTYPIDKEALLNDEYYYGMEWKNWNFNEWYNQYQLQKFRKAEGIE